MRILVARHAGFCFGVRRAVDLAMGVSARRREPVFTCGPLVHNPQVVEMLAERGVGCADDPADLPDGHAVIRSHGLPPDREARLRARSRSVTDATCPRVKRVQEIVADHAGRGCLVLIAGEKEHPEVRGLLGYARGRGTVISGTGEVGLIPEGAEPLCLVAQTTQDAESFREVAAAVKDACGGREVKIVDTICHVTRIRQEEALELAARVDRMIVVGGRGSGNTRRLAQVIRGTGTPVDLVENEAEIPEGLPSGVRRLGITAGASTPAWVLDGVLERLRDLEGRSKFRGAISRFFRFLAALQELHSVVFEGAQRLLDALHSA